MTPGSSASSARDAAVVAADGDDPGAGVEQGAGDRAADALVAPAISTVLSASSLMCSSVRLVGE